CPSPFALGALFRRQSQGARSSALRAVRRKKRQRAIDKSILARVLGNQFSAVDQLTACCLEMKFMAKGADILIITPRNHPAHTTPDTRPASAVFFQRIAS